MTDNMPSGKGTYLLLAQLQEDADIAIGRLGTFCLTAGWYAYAGSALGPGGLRARLSRHLRSGKGVHWHIDYLLARAVANAVWVVESPLRLECGWAAAAQRLPSAHLPVPGFGASDCRCPAHLIHFAQRPTESAIRDVLCQASPNGCLPRAISLGDS
jgi:Uri superfamily endonuclease